MSTTSKPPTRRPGVVAATRTIAYDAPDTLTLEEYRRHRARELDHQADELAELDDATTPLPPGGAGSRGVVANLPPQDFGGPDDR